MAHTMAQRYRYEAVPNGFIPERRNEPRAMVLRWMRYVTKIDPSAEVKRTDLGVVIIFSDGSIHRLGEKYGDPAR